MADYDIRSIFEVMELELIRSMKRNLAKHKKWENKEGINWTMWQVEQLKTLENFKKDNEKLFNDKFSIVNNEIAEFLEETYKLSGIEQEKAILEQLAKGNKVDWKNEQGLEGAFFSLNRDKMNALINATVNDMKKAEHAMLRMVNDQYRKTIYKAHTMLNSGTFTLKQSIDAATKDFLKAGINCIQYKDGRRVNISSYAEMALRTANKRAMLVSEGDVRKAYGIHTVRISKYGQCSETCLPWQGRIYVDDIWSGGTEEEAKEKDLPLLSIAVNNGLFHPNCRHRSTTYFYELEKALENNDGDIENPLEEQEHRKNQLHIQQQKRLEEGSLDPKNIAEAKQRKEMWIEKDNLLIKKFKLNKKDDKIKLDKSYYSRIKVSDSIEDAKEFALAELGLVSVDYENIHIDVANMINSEIAKAYDLFGNIHEKGFLNRIKYYDKEMDGYAAYFKKSGSIYLKNVESKNSLKAMKEEALKQFSIGFWSTDDVAHCIRHELGHAIHNALLNNDTKKMEKISFLREGIKKRHSIIEWNIDEDLSIVKKVGKDLSYYALYNDNEFVAESIAEYMTGDSRVVAKKVVEILLGVD